MTRVPRRSPVLTWLALGMLGLLAAAGVEAQEPAREAAPPPSPRFVRPDSVLFADDFSGDSLRGWKCDTAMTAWSVRGGMLRANLPDVKQAHSFLMAGDSTWTDYAVDFDVCGMRGVDKGLGVRVNDKHGLGVDLRGRRTTGPSQSRPTRAVWRSARCTTTTWW